MRTLLLTSLIKLLYLVCGWVQTMPAIGGRGSGLWAWLSPWLDRPMHRTHWKILCLSCIASAPMGLAAGDCARKRYEAWLQQQQQQQQQRPTIGSTGVAGDSATQRRYAHVTSAVHTHPPVRPPTAEGSGQPWDSGSVSTVVAWVVGPSIVGWALSMVVFPPRS